MRMAMLAVGLISLLSNPLHARQAEPRVAGSPASSPRVSQDAGVASAQAVLVNGELPGPELWLVRSADGLRELYILGTLSPLPAKMRLQSKRIDAVIANAQEVIRSPSISFSVDTGWVRGMLLLPKLLGARKNPDDKKLQDVVSPVSYARWTALKARYIGRDGGIERWRPLFAAQKLYQEAIEDSGMKNSTAINDVVTAAIEAHHPKVTVVNHAIVVKDPKPLLKEFSKTTLDDLSCFDNTMGQIETELETMRLRANAWATADMAALQSLPPPYQWEACSNAISEAGIGKRLGFGDAQRLLEAKWMDAAEAALAGNKVTFAMLPMNRMLAPGGYLAQLKAKGYTVLAPDDAVEAELTKQR
jgi:hypothetical protein